MIEFLDHFKTDEDCKAYLATIKWKDGFCCRHCNHVGWCRTSDPYVRRCNRCKKRDSVTAGTLFHKCRFSLRKAFLIIYEMTCTKKSASSYAIARRYSMRQKTVSAFMQKVRKAMESSGKYPLKGDVEVDEFVVGGPEKGKRGRSKGKKKLVVMGIKHDGFGIHQCYARHIPNAGSEELRPFFEDHIAPSAMVRTDKWRGYRPLIDDYVFLRQEKSRKGENFEYMHRQIMSFKGWLRGIHHKCDHLQAYLNEFSYRFNRLKKPKRIFHNLIVRMVGHEPFTQKEVKLSWSQ